jgi:hypothetical protein
MADEAEADEAEANEAGPGMPVLGEAADDDGLEVAGLGALVDEQEAAAATEVGGTFGRGSQGRGAALTRFSLGRRTPG